MFKGHGISVTFATKIPLHDFGLHGHFHGPALPCKVWTACIHCRGKEEVKENPEQLGLPREGSGTESKQLLPLYYTELQVNNDLFLLQHVFPAKSHTKKTWMKQRNQLLRMDNYSEFIPDFLIS